jgi:hypothetical protein
MSDAPQKIRRTAIALFVLTNAIQRPSAYTTSAGKRAVVWIDQIVIR